MARKREIEFSSGDVMIFPTCQSTNVRHGITRIVPDTCPSYLPELSEQRLMVQMRFFKPSTTTNIVVQKQQSIVVFTPVEALLIHRGLHSSDSTLKLRNREYPIVDGANVRSVELFGVTSLTQVEDDSFWGKKVARGDTITWIKSGEHWGRIINGVIENKGNSIRGNIDGYGLAPKKKAKFSDR
eukprot:TRINITY_DN4947_c0_g1_i3.p1 TRINITY_DN4947_c0_g1~~TRINITY_DN4947_c0_g1_i3.p1  ORF type:complete len:184 (-),score=29.70 TRINITY_DN4947_c0_g1_i3:77-628(-)